MNPTNQDQLEQLGDEIAAALFGGSATTKEHTMAATVKKPRKGQAKCEDPTHAMVQGWGERKCRVCGCTQNRACLHLESGEPCTWAEPDLCSACAEIADGECAAGDWEQLNTPGLPRDDEDEEECKLQNANCKVHIADKHAPELCEIKMRKGHGCHATITLYALADGRYQAAASFGFNRSGLPGHAHDREEAEICAHRGEALLWAANRLYTRLNDLDCEGISSLDAQRLDEALFDVERYRDGIAQEYRLNGHAKGRETRDERRETKPAPLSTLDSPLSAQLIPLADLARNRYNPRQEFDPAELKQLAASIQEHGLLQAIRVREIPAEVRELKALCSIVDPQRPARYELVAGERRALACQLAGLTEVRAEVVAVDDAAAAVEAIVENDDRADLSDIERARHYQLLIERHGFTVTTLAQKLGRAVSTVSNLLRLLELPADLQGQVFSRALSTSHARLLVPYKDAAGVLDKVRKSIAKEGAGSLKEFEETVGYAVHDATEPLTKSVFAKGVYKHADLRIGADHPRYAELEVIEVKKRWGGGTEKRALNQALARELFKEKEKAWHAKNDKAEAKSGAKGKGNTSAASARQQAQAERNAFAEKLECWCDEWRLRLCGDALRDSPPPLTALKVLLFVAAGLDRCGGDESLYDMVTRELKLQRDKPAGPLWSATEARLDEVVARIAAETLHDLSETTGHFAWNSFPREDLAALCKLLAIDPAKTWILRENGKQVMAGELTEAYLELHSIEQLQALADEWGLHAAGQETKPKLVKYLTSQTTRILPLPAELAELLGSGKKKTGPKRKAK